MARHHSVGLLRKILFLGRRTEAPAALVAIEMVDSRSKVTHRVTHEAFAAGHRDGGRYRALCGLLILPATLTAPTRGYCPTCEWGRAPSQTSGATRGG